MKIYVPLFDSNIDRGIDNPSSPHQHLPSGPDSEIHT